MFFGKYWHKENTFKKNYIKNIITCINKGEKVPSCFIVLWQDKAVREKILLKFVFSCAVKRTKYYGTWNRSFFRALQIIFFLFFGFLLKDFVFYHKFYQTFSYGISCFVESLNIICFDCLIQSSNKHQLRAFDD